MTVVVMVLTCGVYALYWNYVVTKDVRELTGADINPETELIINLLTCGIFGVYAEYRNAQLVDAWMTRLNSGYAQKAGTIGMLNVLGFFTYVTWFIASHVFQTELNHAIELHAQQTGAPLS